MLNHPTVENHSFSVLILTLFDTLSLWYSRNDSHHLLRLFGRYSINHDKTHNLSSTKTPHRARYHRARFSEPWVEKVHFTAVPLSARENRLHPFVLRCPPDSSRAWYTCPPTLSACIIQHRYSSACHWCCRLKLRASMCRNQSRPVSSLSRCDILQFLHDSFGETRRRRGWL